MNSQITRRGFLGGAVLLGGAALVAKQLLAANQGTRYIQLTMGGWDNHANIYSPNAGLFSQMKTLTPLP